MKARGLFIAALGAFILQASSALAARRKAPPFVGRTIGSIAIEVNNVFDTSVYPESKLAYRLANRAHRTTREHVVRRELLFAVGQPYDPNLIRETERNLRLLPFIRHASADAVVNSSGTVDVVVRVYDSWSLELVANFKRVGGTTEWRAGFTEHNLLGSGDTASSVYNQNGTSPSKSFYWEDRQFLGRPHLKHTMSADAGPDTRRYAFSVNRPFFASIARASGGLTGNYTETKADTYDGDVRTGAVSRRASELAFTYGVALATSTDRTRRLRAGVMNRHVDFLPLPSDSGPLPAQEQFLVLQIAGDWETLDFVTERRMQKFTQDEDYNLGLGVFPKLSWAPRIRALRSAESQVMPGVEVRKGFDWEDRLLLMRASYGTAFVNGSNANRIAGAEALYFLSGLPRQTLAIHASYDHGWRLDPSSLLALGENNGLRGYGLGQFAGERRALLNVEDRIFLYDQWLRLIDLGAVVFYDSGFAWKERTRTRLAELRHSVGFGLRLAPSRSASNSPLRIDLARALSPNGTKSRWTLSIIGGHAFGPE